MVVSVEITTGSSHDCCVMSVENSRWYSHDEVYRNPNRRISWFCGGRNHNMTMMMNTEPHACAKSCQRASHQAMLKSFVPSCVKSLVEKTICEKYMLPKRRSSKAKRNQIEYSHHWKVFRKDLSSVHAPETKILEYRTSVWELLFEVLFKGVSTRCGRRPLKVRSKVRSQNMQWHAYSRLLFLG